VASSVVGAIEPRLRHSEIERATRKPTVNLDAYDLYLRALAQVRNLTRESVAEAVDLAHRALELDPGYAPAMAMIGWGRFLQRARDWVPPTDEAVDDGVVMARQAIATARDNTDVLWAASYSLAYLAGENDSGLDAIGRAIVLNPNCADALGFQAVALAC